MLRIHPQAMAAHQQGGCLSVTYCHSPETSFVPLCLNAVRRTLLCFSTQLRLMGVRINSAKNAYPWSVFMGCRDSYLDLICRLQRLSVKIKESSPCYVLKLKSSGPLVVVAGHLVVPPALEILTPNKYLTSIAAESVLDLELVFTSYSLSYSWRENRNVHGAPYGFTVGSHINCSFYGFRLNLRAREESQELALLEILSPGTYGSVGVLVTTCLRLFRNFKCISRVVLSGA